VASGYVEFIDIIGENASKAPLARGGMRAYYATGPSYIEETAAQVAAAKAAGMGLAMIDQTPSLSLWKIGWADIADYENFAGTLQSVIEGVRSRQDHGWLSTIYVSDSNQPGLESALRIAGVNMSLVMFGVANYSWSLQQAEQLLADNPSWAYIQFGDNHTNADTRVPGTNVTCGQAGCDIDVASLSWALYFLPHQSVVPDVRNMRVATEAEPELKRLGFTWKTNPPVSPAAEWEVDSQTPAPGTVAATGSNVDLGIHQITL
jgi:hypothetical protein